MRSRPADQEWGRGRPADRSQASRFRGSRISGQAVPGVYGPVSGRAQVRIDLAGDVALQAADDLGLGRSVFAAVSGVGAGGRVAPTSPCRIFTPCMLTEANGGGTQIICQRLRGDARICRVEGLVTNRKSQTTTSSAVTCARRRTLQARDHHRAGCGRRRRVF